MKIYVYSFNNENNEQIYLNSKNEFWYGSNTRFLKLTNSFRSTFSPEKNILVDNILKDLQESKNKDLLIRG